VMEKSGEDGESCTGSEIKSLDCNEFDFWDEISSKPGVGDIIRGNELFTEFECGWLIVVLLCTKFWDGSKFVGEAITEGGETGGNEPLHTLSVIIFLVVFDDY
jgi:hypothetical protein